MCGIFAYLNYNINRERSYILQVLFNGLRRLEYRGYDSAGISIDHSSDPNSLPSSLVFRQEGNIESLVKSVYQGATFFIFHNLIPFSYFSNSTFCLFAGLQNLSGLIYPVTYAKLTLKKKCFIFNLLVLLRFGSALFEAGGNATILPFGEFGHFLVVMINTSLELWTSLFFVGHFLILFF